MSVRPARTGTAAPHFARRSLIAAAPVAAGALLLPGCTTARLAGTGPSPCPPPVRVAANRVIRTVAGLRPYRASGFVVRSEERGGKRIVHNYGHGGAGITLSWGTARLAVEQGQAGDAGPVAVLGAGAVGLATARLAQDAGREVTLYAAALPPYTVSNIAGGQILPTGHYDDDAVTPAWMAQYRAAMDYGWRRFQILVGERYGVRWVPTWHRASRSGGEDWLAAYRPGETLFAAGRHPFGDTEMRRFDTMYVETGRYLAQLLADFRIAGGRVVLREFSAVEEVAALSERVVFNCTGLGSRALFGDEALVPVRGQLAILLPQPEIDYAYAAGGGYMFPRDDGIVLGGTFERGIWDETPEPQAIERILARHEGVARGWACPA